MDTQEYRDKYGIQVMYPGDLFRTKQERKWDDEDGSYEFIAMVCETNTATRQDLADCLSHAWMMTQFHYSGYTQIISKYLHHIKGIHYRKFYDHLYQVIKNDPVAGEILANVEEILISYLQRGEVPDEERWGNVVALTLSESYGGNIILENKEYYINLGIQAANHFVTVDPCITELQHGFIKDNNKQYPLTIHSSIDIDRWIVTNCVYTVNKRDAVSHMQDQMYEKFLRKTDIVNVTDPYNEVIEAGPLRKPVIPILPIVSNVHTGMLL
jgi:hypothetical protein